MKKTKTREHRRHIHLVLRADNNLNYLFDEGTAVAFLCPQVQKGCPSKRSCLPVATYGTIFLKVLLSYPPVILNMLSNFFTSVLNR